MLLNKQPWFPFLIAALRKGALTAVGLAIVTVSYYLYGSVRHDAETDKWHGLTKTNGEYALHSPVSFCNVTEKWPEKGSGGNYKEVDACFDAETQLTYRLEDSSDTAGSKVKIVFKRAACELSVELSEPNDDCQWNQVRVVVQNGPNKRIYSAKDHNAVLEEIELPLTPED